MSAELTPNGEEVKGLTEERQSAREYFAMKGDLDSVESIGRDLEILESQTPDQNPPVDPAALAAAETKVLPRPPEGYRILEVGEKIHTGDKFVGIRLEFSQGFDTHCAGETVPNHTDGLYFRRIEPAPAALAETKVLPRFPGYREMEVGEILADGDMVLQGDVSLLPTLCAGMKVWKHERGLYFRPIDPVPHTDPRISDESPAGLVMGALAESLNSLAPQAPEGSSPADPDTTGCDHEPECITMYEDGRLGQIQCSECEAPMEAVHSGEQKAARHELIALRARLSTLTDALTKARDALRAVLDLGFYGNNPGMNADAVNAVVDQVHAAKSVLDAPALVQALKGGDR